MRVSKKQYQDLLDRVNDLESQVALLTRQEGEREDKQKSAEEKKPFEEIKREWMLYPDERKGASA